jgi:hypothetical protein
MKKLLLLITLVAGVIAFALPAQATIIEYGLDIEFSGATPPESTTVPWITAKFDDSYGGATGVRLTMSAVNLTHKEFIDEWLFNFDTALNPTNLSFALVGTPGSTPINIYTGVDAYKADGGGYYDIKFDFPPPPGNLAGKFTHGETVVYDISHNTLNIDVNSFHFSSSPSGSNGTYNSAAHIQGIGTSDDDSGWIGNRAGGGPGFDPIPEPATMLLLGSGLIGFAVSGKKKFKKRNG